MSKSKMDILCMSRAKSAHKCAEALILGCASLVGDAKEEIQPNCRTSPMACDPPREMGTVGKVCTPISAMMRGPAHAAGSVVLRWILGKGRDMSMGTRCGRVRGLRCDLYLSIRREWPIMAAESKSRNAVFAHYRFGGASG